MYYTHDMPEPGALTCIMHLFVARMCLSSAAFSRIVTSALVRGCSAASSADAADWGLETLGACKALSDLKHLLVALQRFCTWACRPMAALACMKTS